MVNRKPELTKQEMEGFDAFVRQHYVEALKQAVEAVRSWIFIYGDKQDDLASSHDPRVLAIFDKIASPRIYLIDAWRKLSDEEHKVYTYPDPVEREKARAEAMRI